MYCHQYNVFSRTGIIANDKKPFNRKIFLSIALPFCFLSALAGALARMFAAVDTFFGIAAANGPFIHWHATFLTSLFLIHNGAY